jgi:SOS-response transcriptional repressor LexA
MVHDARPPLTPKEAWILERIRDYLEHHEFPPTIRELADYAPASQTMTFYYLQALRLKGYISQGRTRTMKIIP